MLQESEVEAERTRLAIHLAKTKVLNNGIGSSQQVNQIELKSRQVEVLGTDSSPMYVGRLRILQRPYDEIGS